MVPSASFQRVELTNADPALGLYVSYCQVRASLYSSLIPWTRKFGVGLLITMDDLSLEELQNALQSAQQQTSKVMIANVTGCVCTGSRRCSTTKTRFIGQALGS